MKLIEYAMAWAALPLLLEKEFPYRTAFALVGLKRRIKPEVDFITSEEEKLAIAYGETDEKGRLIVEGGRFRFKGADDAERAANAQAFKEHRDALFAVEAGEVFERVSVELAAKDTLRASALEALEPFVEFTIKEE